jgi:hypothetical protein
MVKAETNIAHGRRTAKVRLAKIRHIRPHNDSTLFAIGSQEEAPVREDRGGEHKESRGCRGCGVTPSARKTVPTLKAAMPLSFPPLVATGRRDP